MNYVGSVRQLAPVPGFARIVENTFTTRSSPMLTILRPGSENDLGLKWWLSTASNSKGYSIKVL